MNHTNISAFIWSVADLLRGDYKQADYGKVILPFTLLRRLDCVLEPTKAAVLKEHAARKGLKMPLHDFLVRKAKQTFYNTSPLDFEKLLADANNIRKNLIAYVGAFSDNARDIFERYDFQTQIDKLDGANLLYQVVERFAKTDLHPDKVSNADMGLVFEELIRRFAELSNETAGEHYTPREVIRLMVDLLFIADTEALSKPGTVRSLYDPTAGTGGMLSVAEEYLRGLNPKAELVVYGQELNPESYAICKADMLIKGQDVSNIVFGNTLSNDGHAGATFDYGLANPPFGVEWKKVEKEVRDEAEKKGHHGRFGAGLPRVSDGSLLFLMHLLSKMRAPSEGGGRIGVVLNGSSLFTGGAGSGESDIRKWVIENDWLEAVVALPTDMFYNTPIATYVWILTNHKASERRGKVQLINAVDFFRKLRKGLGAKRRELGESDIERIVKLYGAFETNEWSKVIDRDDFGYRTITVERPLRLNFAVSPERLAGLDDVSALTKLGKDLPKLKAALAKLDGGKVWKAREPFQKTVRTTLDAAKVFLAPPSVKALVQALSERDEAAEVCVDSKGNPEPDADLRDTENVPLKDDVHAYFAREVLPHVPDAWIDDEKTTVGYEILYNRHFYKYVAPRPLDEIDAELKAKAGEIMELLAEVTKRQEVIASAVSKGLNPATPMKNTGIEWLGEVPEHWEIVPNRTCLTLRREIVGSSSSDYVLLSLTKQGIIPRDMENPEGKFPSSFDTYQVVRKGDLVFCLFDVDETPRTVGMAGCDGMMTGAYTRFTCSSPDVAEFIMYYYMAMDDGKRLKPLYSGLRKVIRKSTFLSARMPLPPQAERLEICAQIKNEYQKIDVLIAKLRALTDLALEHRNAHITAAVTGKIDLRDHVDAAA